MSTADFLVEIGTEELPPKALRNLMDAFGRNLTEGVDEARLEHGDVHAYASPRRLAVVIDELALRQEDRRVEQKGPPVKVAFDDDGKPTPAALAFAKKCGVEVDALDRASSDKGEWLVYEKAEEGQRPNSSRISSSARSTRCRSRAACAGARANTSSCARCTGW